MGHTNTINRQDVLILQSLCGKVDINKKKSCVQLLFQVSSSAHVCVALLLKIAAIDASSLLLKILTGSPLHHFGSFWFLDPM